MFSLRVYKEIQTHARACYPEESCGLVINGEYQPQINQAENKKDHFKMDIDKYPLDDSLQAIVHSHPDSKTGVEPSVDDMLGQIATDKPWGIVAVYSDGISEPMFFGDGIPLPDLIARPFRSGPTGTDGKGDCYSIIRDYYWIEKQIRLNEYPRDDAWWADPLERSTGDMYTQNFKDCGFDTIEERDLQIGDVVLMAIRSKKPNHAGVYVGRGLLLHHLQHRLSRREPILPYRRLITNYLRYHGK